VDVLRLYAQRYRNTAYLYVMAGLGALIVALTLRQVFTVAISCEVFWWMTALAVLAASRSFVTSRPDGSAIVICPTICFTFAILLTCGLGPALVAELLTMVVVQWRLRLPLRQSIVAAGHYALAFVAASIPLAIGPRDPFDATTSADMVASAVTVVASVGAWLLTYRALAAVAAKVRGGSSHALELAGVAGDAILVQASLLLLGPVLAVAAHFNVAFLPLVLVPLYAVDRMARLSAERDRAVRRDPLTGLANRAGLRLRFNELAAAAAGNPDGIRVALSILDLDRFKQVNDTLGHEVGDRLLEAVAERLNNGAPSGGLVARLGGDEFAVLSCVDSVDQAFRQAERVVAGLSAPVTLDGLEVDVTASVGIALHLDHGADFAELMRHADIAMYEAKQRGDTIAVYEPQSDHNTPEGLGLLSDFRRALETNNRQQIEMHYQPQVTLDTARVVGVEALLRWRHPRHGLIGTQELLQAAENTSIMHLLTQRVIDDVVAQVAAWSAEGTTLRASFNVGSRDLYSGDIVAHLAEQLARHAVAPEQIQVEITESALMGDPTRALATTARIAELGVAISLDDFGTGYSSLQHLRKLPLTELKIDRSFVLGMASNGDDSAIVTSTVGMAHSLGLRTVAEGVETQYTRQLLAEAGCTLAQGWLTARAMPGAEVPAWVARWSSSMRQEVLEPTD
jgi:diguanylate cyclase (GGDEF)-like protein